MKTLILSTVALSAALAATGFCQDDPDANPGSRSPGRVAATPEVLARSESQITLTIWKPEHAGAAELLRYASDLTERYVEFYALNPLNGEYERKRRDRFVVIEGAIGIQDFSAGRAQALELLAMLDARIGELAAAPAAPEEEVLTRTVRPRSMGVDAAVALLSEMDFDIALHIVRPTATLVLSGPKGAVARAESLLRDVDQPVPQMKLLCTLIEATDEAAAAPAALDEDLARGLAEILPERHFRTVGRFMLRAAAGGGVPFELSSHVVGLASPDGGAEHPPRFTLSAVSQGWDADQGVLNLGSCSFLLERPTFQPIQNGTVAQRQFTGYTHEGLSTSLALRAGETTVIGSLGGDPVFIVLRYEIE